MDILCKYLGRVLEAWWIKLILSMESVLSLVAFVFFFFVRDFSFPWWVFWLFGFAIILTFGYANFRLFAEQESEKQRLQDRINEYEDTRANIYLKNTENFCYALSLRSRYFSHEGKTFHQASDYLYRNGLPIGLMIGALLKVVNQSNESGDFDWQITKVDMPGFFNLVEIGKDSFKWGRGFGLPLVEVTGSIRKSDAKCELPIKITIEDPRSFAQRLSSPGSYRIVIEYRTIRIDDSKSKPHSLELEGDFQEFRDQICKAWKNSKLDELAQLAECE